jgi:hypothetical protein
MKFKETHEMTLQEKLHRAEAELAELRRQVHTVVVHHCDPVQTLGTLLDDPNCCSRGSKGLTITRPGVSDQRAFG